jgi:hypothetical protein
MPYILEELMEDANETILVPSIVIGIPLIALL